MKLTQIFTGFVAFVLCCSHGFAISAIASDTETRQAKFYDNYMNFVWTCDTNADCTTPESSCVEKQCQCPPNYVFNAAMTSCIKAAEKYDDTCEETVQCTAYLKSGGTCTDGKCNCAPGYHYLHGRCNKSSGLKEKCRNDDDCYVNADLEALSCTNGVCHCRDGFYQREYRTCRRAAKEIGDYCMIDLDCTFDENAQCDKSTGCFIESNTNKSLTFKLKKDTTEETPGFQAVNSNIQVQSDCKTDAECKSLGEAICDAAGTCICKPGYFIEAKMTKCGPELGEKCTSTDEVVIKNSICRDGQWNCYGTVPMIPAINNRKCIKVTRVYNNSCTQPEQCYIFGPDASCVDKKCLCNENSHYSDKYMFCWMNKGVGESCERDLDCYVKGFGSVLTCGDNSICQCPKGTHVNAAGTACIGDIAALGDSCTADEDCRPLKNAVCQNETCSCDDNHFEMSGECVAGVNAHCRNDIDCKAENSTCNFGTCDCKPGFVSPTPALCIQVSSFLDLCQYDVQCLATAANSFCWLSELPVGDESPINKINSDDGICFCVDGHHYKDGNCHQTKYLDEPCNYRDECYVESDPETVVCRKGICSCEWNTIATSPTFCKNVSIQITLSGSIGAMIIILRFVTVL